MNGFAADKARMPVAPPEPISPAPSASAAPTSALGKPASPTPAPTPESARAPLPSSAFNATAARESAQTAPSAPAAAPSLASASVAATASTTTTSVAVSSGATATASAPAKGRAPSPAQAPAREPSKESANPPGESKSPKHPNGHKISFGDDPDSELSEPASSVHSPSGVRFNELEDEIVVGERNIPRKWSPLRVVLDREDEVMADADDEPIVSHYPKRKRISLFNDLSESKIEIPKSVSDDKPTPTDSLKPKPARPSLSNVKGAILGYWRDSPAPDERSKHAVIGFIDVRDRLRTRIQAINSVGESVTEEYPLPPGPGGSWVTFDRIVFSDHLVNLDHRQVKEYVRIRSDPPEETDEERKAAGKLAVREAKQRVKMNPLVDNPNPPLIAYGLDMPEHLASSDAKRRRVSGGFATINPAPTNGVSHERPGSAPQPLAAHPMRPPVDPLPGTRPTRILLGYWKGSSEPSLKDRHAVYGILDGNFPIGAGALWIQYEEVEFEDHLKPLARHEIKEYCRVRQWQLDHGETPDERAANEVKAVQEAQVRAGTGFKNIPLIAPSYPPIAPEPPADVVDQNEKAGFGGHELRQSRVEAKTDGHPARQPLPNGEIRQVVNRAQSGDALERTNTLARREIARAEAAQGRADRHAASRERAAAAAADATAAAAAAAIPAVTTHGRMRFHESEEMQRLNKVWARQESLRAKAGAEDAKIYGGIKYERKTTGPFMGKLVSQGTIINIDGEDYVNYRVLTKPSFF
ncbi:hypothetical protein B0J13DRAFT_574069 [Dactylonectria estremocensis]|uniref:Uncharacterized protein n=1 Tax=Dactylonectria estremocensis TaxID=1079267 RepID=A0A9P9IAD0_9HYPO|nr:hypothetical protein B0J13DRAFT_574069 [Dactylonectria estremocensis]